MKSSEMRWRYYYYHYFYKNFHRAARVVLGAARWRTEEICLPLVVWFWLASGGAGLVVPRRERPLLHSVWSLSRLSVERIQISTSFSRVSMKMLLLHTENAGKSFFWLVLFPCRVLVKSSRFHPLAGQVVSYRIISCRVVSSMCLFDRPDFLVHMRASSRTVTIWLLLLLLAFLNHPIGLHSHTTEPIDTHT